MVELICSMVLCIVLMIVPGLLILRAARLSWAASLCASPLISIPGYCLVTIALSKAGIPASTATVAGPMVIVSAIALAASFALGTRRAQNGVTATATVSILPADTKKNWLLICLYLIAGFLATRYVFLGALGQPDGIIQAWDNAFHYGQIRSFLESGIWSPLYASRYLTPAAAAFDPFPSSGYYPAAWHVMSVMLCDTLGASVGVAGNAAIAAFICFGLPSGMFLLATCIFGSKTTAVGMAAISCVSFSAFPWAFLCCWTATPNLISTCLVPALISVFMAAISHDASRRMRITLVFIFVAGVLCMAFTQPNSVFTAAVFLTPYVFWRIWTEISAKFNNSPKRRKWLFVSCGGWLAFVAVVWVGLFNAPFLQSLVQFDWGQFLSWERAITGVLTLSFVEWNEQILLALVVYAGIAYSFKHREFLWLSAAYAMAAIMCAFADAGASALPKHLLTGFWYTDPYRLAAVVALFGMPLSALGAYGAFRLAKRLLAKVDFESKVPYASKVLTVALAALFVGAVFVTPATQKLGTEIMNDTLYGSLRYRLWSETAMDSGNGKIQYDDKKRAFVHKVMETIPADAVIINQPYDGSIWAYGLDGLNIVNRYMGGYGDEGERPENAIIRRRANRYATSTKGMSAMKNTKAAYLLHLDHQRANMEKTPNRPYVPWYWVGIDSVNDSTPGYKVVLEDENMRLYKITYPKLSEQTEARK